ncbi:MAG: calcium-binding protein [Nannocystaceae bacterium]
MIRRLALALLLPLPLVAVAGCDSEELPGSREGEVCEAPAGEAAPCTDDEDELGNEFCITDWTTYESHWSACFIETCEAHGERRDCSGGGVQYCFRASEEFNHWGECLKTPECEPGEERSCGLGGDFDFSMTCRLDSVGEPGWNPEDCNTPLVLSFDGRAPAFAAPPAAAAAFDINGAGACVSPEWPTAATPWLALDRDRNGAIDGGHELFGNGTRMASGRRADQGFDALSDLDSDNDGRITPADAAWDELVLWADHDGDRQSSGWELLPLAAYGVESIDLDYRAERVCDSRGNCGNERAAFTFRDGGAARQGEVVDVYVACGD